MTTTAGTAARSAQDRIDAVAQKVADRGRGDFHALLGYKPLEYFGLDVTVGGLLAAVLAVVGAWLLSALVRHWLTGYARRNPNANRASLYTLSRLVQYVLLLVGVLIGLDHAGIPVSKLTVFAGAIGVGLGFGLQAIFSNFVSGLILLFDRSLKVGDFVELESGARGEVRDIKIRATRIATNDNIDILVPNSEFVTGKVTNWTLYDGSRRVRIPFGVGYGSDKDTVRAAALEAAAEVPFTLTQDGPRAPQVWLVEFGDSSLNFELVVWLTADATKRPGAVKAAYLWALHSALVRHAIEIPFPQRDLHLRSVFGREGEDAIALLRAQSAPASPAGPRTERTRAGDLSINDALREVEADLARDAEAAAARDDATNRNP